MQRLPVDHLCHRALLGSLALALTSAVAASDLPAAGLPLPVNGSTVVLPGQGKETRLSTDGTVDFNQVLGWQTSAAVRGTRYSQPTPLRSESVVFDSGPRVRLGNGELVLPFHAGSESLNGSQQSSFAGGAPRLTVKINKRNSVKVEARALVKNDAHNPQSSTVQKGAKLSWKHALGEHWSVRAGIERSSDQPADAPAIDRSAAFANLNAELPQEWRLSFGGSAATSAYRSGDALEEVRRDRLRSFSMSAQRKLPGGWAVSGALSVSQTEVSGNNPSAFSQGGMLKLTRDF